MKKTSRSLIRVYIVDDHPIIRDGLRKALGRRKHIEVVGEASDGRTALVEIPGISPDIVILDVTLNGVSGIEVARKLRKKCPSIHVLMFTVHEEREYVLELARMGVRGYLLKEASREEIVKAVESVYDGQVYFSGRASNAIVTQYVHRAGVNSSLGSDLTGRELDVLKLIAEGLRNKDIARALGVSVRTVQSHREGLMEKLDIHTAAGLTKYAITKGLVHLGG